MNTVLPLVGALLAYLLYHTLTSIISKRRTLTKAAEPGCKSPPLSPNKLPFGFDHIQRALKADQEKCFPDMLLKRVSEMGANTFQTNMIGSEILFIAEPKNIKAILATQFADFCLGQTRRGNFFPLLGNGIFTQDGKDWEHSRAMLRPQFAREQTSDLELEEYHVQNMMRAITVDPKSGWSKQVDLQVLFFRLTLDSATELLFGESADSQIAELLENKMLSAHVKPTARDEVVFANAFDTSQKALSTRLRFADKYWLYNSASFRSANKICHEFIDHYVQIALKGKIDSTEAPDAKKVTKKEKYVFLEALVAQTREPIELRSQLLNILLAGRDTTASLLGWLFYLLARHPAIFHRLRTTVISEFGTYASPAEISFAKIKGCQYLQHCLSETLRLYPVVPMNIRYATKDTTLPVGGGPDGTSPVFVKKGMQVEYSVHVMHRRKDLWGEDADAFRPERWAEGAKVGWEFLPFNGGPRICIGQQFALTEASYVAIRLLQRFDGMEDLLLEEERSKHNLTLTNCSASGVVVRLHEAEEG